MMILYFDNMCITRPYVVKNISNPKRAILKAVFIGLKLQKECKDGRLLTTYYNSLIDKKLSEIKKELKKHDLRPSNWDVLNPETNELEELR